MFVFVAVGIETGGWTCEFSSLKRLTLGKWDGSCRFLFIQFPAVVSLVVTLD